MRRRKKRRLLGDIAIRTYRRVRDISISTTRRVNVAHGDSSPRISSSVAMMGKAMLKEAGVSYLMRCILKGRVELGWVAAAAGLCRYRFWGVLAVLLNTMYN